MQALAAVAIGILVATSALVAIRLLALHRRTRAAPELLLGAMLLLSVGVGYPLLIAASRAGGRAAGALLVVSTLAVNVGFSLLFVFTWRVFHPEARWARALAGAGVAALMLKALDRLLDVQSRGAIHVSDEPLSESLLQTAPVLAAYLWTAWESLRYHGLMRRRVRLDLADPAVSNRLLLWGLTALCVAVGVAVNSTAIALRVDVLATPWVLLLSSATGLAQAVLLVLAFVPPRGYLRWVRGRAAAAGG